MAQDLGPELRDHLTRYLAGEIGLQAFQEWFVPSFWNLPTPEVAPMAARAVELALAEYTGGHLSEDELRDQLRPLVRTLSVQVGQQVSTRTESSSAIRSILIGGHSHMAAVRWGW